MGKYFTETAKAQEFLVLKQGATTVMITWPQTWPRLGDLRIV